MIMKNSLPEGKMLSDMARYLKHLLPARIPAIYSVKPMFVRIESEENIRSGILALKDFMSIFYDLLIEDSAKYEKPKAMSDKGDRKPSLAVDFPFIYHVKSVLLNIGYHSMLNGDVLTFSGLKNLTPIICCEGMEASTKIPTPRLVDCLRFLNECGMYFEGFDIDQAKSYMTSERLVEVTYPDNPIMLTGLKIMAVAQRDMRWKTNDEIFLRCDYRALTNDKMDIDNVIKDFIRPFSSEVHKFIWYLHQKCLEKGVNCTVKTGLKNSFLYAYKKNVLWELSSSFACGYRIFVKMQNKHSYHYKTMGLSPLLQEIVDKDYGCEKKRFHKPCEKDCCGFYLPLDDAFLSIYKDIKQWIDLEKQKT